jgi:Zn-finger nucleic acid-binding protein
VLLLACTRCHAQYDVSQVDTPELTCRCGHRIENRPPQGRDTPALRCGACGAHLTPKASACTYCGASVVRSGTLPLICPECCARNALESRFCTACGVAFRPEPIARSEREFPCPHCAEPLTAQNVSGAGLHVCQLCQGIWLPGRTLERMIERAVESQRKQFAGTGSEPRRSGGEVSAQPVRYIRCPECSRFMNRWNYARASGVIVDCCREHGTWLDADELEQIAGYLVGQVTVNAGGGPGSHRVADGGVPRPHPEPARTRASARDAYSESTGYGKDDGYGESAFELFFSVMRKLLE